MPAFLYLHEFGSQVWAAFGHPPYLVGSALLGNRTPNDIDVRLILPDDQYEQMFGDPDRTHSNGKWVSMVLAYSALGKAMTGLPIDFQIQSQSKANAENDGPRSALGLTPLRMT